MAGFEVIVRPVVFPNIRPASPRVLAPVDDPEQGIAVISGSGGKLIDLPHTWSVSVSRQKPHTEAVRQYDTERIHQVDEQGNINEDNFVDVERLRKVRLNKEGGPYKVLYADPPPRDNVKPLETSLTRLPPGAQYIYRPGD